MAGSRTRVVAACIAAVVGIGLLLPAAAEASGGRGALRFRLSASSGLRGGQTIDYEMTGRALAVEWRVDVWQCDGRVRRPGDLVLDDLNRSCTSLDSRTVLEAGRVTGSITVQEVFATFSRELEVPGAVHCGDRRYDCAMVAVVYDASGTVRAPVSVVPIDVIPSPVAVGGAGLGGGSVQVWASGRPRAQLVLAQCVRFPGVPRDLGSCANARRVVLSRAGQAHTEMPVAPSLVVDGRTYDCRSRPCQVTSFDRAGAILGAADIPGSVHYADITLDPSTDLMPGDIIQARIESAIPAFSSYIGLCLASVLEDLPPAEGCYVYFPVTGPGVHVYDLIAYEPLTPYGGGPAVSCRDDPGGCIIGVGTEGTVSGYAPISFASPAGAPAPP